MKNILAVLIALAVSPFLRAETPPPKYGPPQAPHATPLSQDHAYFQDPGHSAPDFWALIPYYVPQLTECSCSVASVAAVVNAATRAGRPLAAADRNATHASLLEGVRSERWAERCGKKGVDGVPGLTLVQLRRITEEALALQGAAGCSVRSVEVTEATPEAREKWESALRANEKSSKNFMLVHFTQDTLTASEGGPYPHISPVGAYDATRRRVLVLDVDREYYEPYWVDPGKLLEAMAVKTPGLGHGGYLIVEVP